MDALTIMVPQHIKYQKYNVFDAKKFKKNSTFQVSTDLNQTSNTGNVKKNRRNLTVVKDRVEKSMRQIFEQFRERVEKEKEMGITEKIDLERNHRL